MNLKLAGILDATRLVSGGQLLEATAAIQRALRATDVSPPPETADAAVIEGSCRVVDVTPVSTSPEWASYDVSPACDPSPVPARAPRPSRFVSRTYTDAAGSRVYKTYIPGIYHGQALPLVVMLHGCQQNPDDFAAGTRMNALAEENGFVVVYPEQAGNANVSRCWNWFQASDQQRDLGEPSLIAGITREALAEFGLDSRRVYVAGLSAGGAMAAVMGATYPDVYAAVGIHSGLAYAAAHDMMSALSAMRGDAPNAAGGETSRRRSARRVPTIVFHGDGDTTVHPNNGDELIAQAAAASSGLADLEVTFTARAATQESGESSGRTYTRTSYRDPGGKTVLEQWLVHGSGHAWSGGSAQGSFSDPHGPDASREMLRFFLQHQGI